MIPHHLAYPEGMRGVNWQAFDDACTLVVEIYSEHGNSEDDRGPLTFFNHSMGGRQTSQTARAALDAGLRFGFVASSDSHSGFPGAYGEGLVAVLSEGLDLASIADAINALFWKWRAPPIPSSLSTCRPRLPSIQRQRRKPCTPGR